MTATVETASPWHPNAATTGAPAGPCAFPLDLGRIAQDLQIRKIQVESVVQLLDEGNTVPFITRYRKERTGGLNEDIIRLIQKRVGLQRQLAERKQTVLKSIEAQGKLTDQLRRAILTAETPRRVEDLYLPFKPKKKTLASVARDKGLEPLAMSIWNRDPVTAQLDLLWPTFVNPEKELATPDEVKQGVGHILAEMIAETAEVRESARRLLWDTGKVTVSKADHVPATEGLEYKDYFAYSEPARQIPPHRVLAINRGEKENVLNAKFEWHTDALQQAVFRALSYSLPAAARESESAEPGAPAPGTGEPMQSGSHDALPDHPHAEFLKTCALDALQRLLIPSLEREIRRDLTDRAEDHAVQVFSRNLRRLLLQPPVRGHRVLSIDPGFRMGCKLAALDEFGNHLEEGLIHLPHVMARRDGRRSDRHGDKKRAEAVPGPTSNVEAAAPVPSAEAGTKAASPSEAPLAGPPASPDVAQDAAPSAAPEAESSPTALVEATQSPDPAAPTLTSSADPVAALAAKREEAKRILESFIAKHQLTVVAIGNGTACRETEELVAELISERCPNLAYVIVNEAGASHYSASAVGREEFPNMDAMVRGTISIGRRLQDPLSELVKIDPQNIGVGLYQHDLSEKRLKESLDGVVESCVNHVGVDVNTASVPLLRHVSGLNQLTARNLVEHRRERGAFRNREEIRQVSGIGDAVFTQAAGFLKIPGGDNPLDETWIHPESYPPTQKLLAHMGYDPESLRDPAKLEEMREKLKVLPTDDVAKLLEIGVPTFRDIAEALSRPGRDPREDLPTPIFKKGILKLEDLKPGLELKGTVLNVVDFGAFVDVGLKDSGLVHISQLANRFVKSPYDVVSVGDVITVWVLTVDQDRRRVSLTMIPPGTERKPPDRRPVQMQRRPEGSGAGPQSQGSSHRHRPPPRRQPAPAAQHAPAAQSGEGMAAATAEATPPVKRPPARPVPQRPVDRRPRREKPPPKLSQEQLQGATELHTFAELKALYEAKKPKE